MKLQIMNLTCLQILHNYSKNVKLHFFRLNYYTTFELQLQWYMKGKKYILNQHLNILRKKFDGLISWVLMFYWLISFSNIMHYVMAALWEKLKLSFGRKFDFGYQLSYYNCTQKISNPRKSVYCFLISVLQTRQPKGHWRWVYYLSGLLCVHEGRRSSEKGSQSAI